jgi:hypothetical protein
MSYPDMENFVPTNQRVDNDSVDSAVYEAYRRNGSNSMYEFRMTTEDALQPLFETSILVLPQIEDHMGILTTLAPTYVLREGVTLAQLAALFHRILPDLFINRSRYGASYKKKMAESFTEVESMYLSGATLTSEERKMIYCESLKVFDVQASATAVITKANNDAISADIAASMSINTMKYTDLKKSSQYVRFVDLMKLICLVDNVCRILPQFVSFGVEKAAIRVTLSPAYDITSGEVDTDIMNSYMFVKFVFESAGRDRGSMLHLKLKHEAGVKEAAHACAKYAKSIKNATDKW